MEAIIRTENKTLFEALLQFLNKLNFTVETREEKKFFAKTKQNKKYPLEGTVLKYTNPFDPATKISEWEAAK